MARDAPPKSRFRAFTAVLGLTSTPQSPPDQLSPGALRPVSASSFRSLYGNYTLFLRVHSAQNLSAVTQGCYCKLYLGDSPLTGGFGQKRSLLDKHDRVGSSHQTFHTKVQMGTQKGNPEWNEKFQLNVQDPQTEILTIRVKNHVLLYSPALGACVVQLRQVQLGETVDDWFPLYKNNKPSGHLRLQLCLQQNGQNPVPERRYSQPNGEQMQKMIQDHREQQENARKQMELLLQEKWKQMEESELKQVGLRDQKEREDMWKERSARRQEEEKYRQDDPDCDLPASFKNRGVKEEEDVASQLMKELSVKENSQKPEVSSGISSGYTDYGNSSEFSSLQVTSFGTIRLSVEELDRVAHNALPSSDSSEETERRRRSQRHRNPSRRKSKKHAKRRVYSDNDSDSSSSTSRGYGKHSSRTKTSEEEVAMLASGSASASSQSFSTENESRKNWETPTTLSYPLNPSDKSSLASEDSHSRRRRRRRAEKARKREKERKHRSKRRAAKSRRSYDSDSSSSSSLSSSSSISSSEEERLRRKLKKNKAKKAKARALRAESGGSRASRRTSGIQDSNKLSWNSNTAESRSIDNIPHVTQKSRPNKAASFQANNVGGNPPTHFTGEKFEASTVSSSTREQPLRSSKDSTKYVPDGMSYELDQQTMPQYPRQTTNEQTNTELMRSFCF